MQPSDLYAAGSKVAEQANDQLDTLKAIKGEAFAQMVTEVLHVRSAGTIIINALDDENPLSTLAFMTVTGLQARFLAIMSEKLGISPTDPVTVKEINEWADRIHESATRSLKTELELAKD